MSVTNIEEALYSKLSTTSGITALASTRIYPTRAPQDAPLPYIVYFRTGLNQPSAMGVDTGTKQSFFQISCFADSFARAKAVAEAVKTTITRWDATSGSVTIQDTFIETELSFYENDTEVFHIVLTFNIWHS